MTEASQSSSVENANLGEEETPNPNEESSTSNTPHVVKRLVGQREKLRTTNSELDSENGDLANEVIRLNKENEQLRSQGSPQAVNVPDPDDFETTEEFNEANRKFIVDTATQATQNVISTQADSNRVVEFDSKVDKHYQSAEKLGKSDYEQAEVNAVNELGATYVDNIVANVDNSAELLYMLGNSPKEMDRIKGLLRSNPAKATLEIGRLSANAGSFNKQSVPAPEDGLEEGGKTPSAAEAGLLKKYNAALKKASDTGDNTGFREIRKQCKEAGLL